MKFYKEDRNVKVYDFDKNTGEFLGERFDLVKSGTGIAANCTELKPLDCAENEVVIFDGDKWSIKPDFRGQTVYNKQNKASIEAKQIGEISDNYTIIKPLHTYDEWNGAAWVENEFNKTQCFAQGEQNWVRQELSKCDIQRRYSFDTKRFKFPSITKLNQYVIALRDYVTKEPDGTLKVHGERPNVNLYR